MNIIYNQCTNLHLECETKVLFILKKYEEEFIDMCVLYVPYFDRIIKNLSKHIRKINKCDVINIVLHDKLNLCVYTCKINIKRLYMVMEVYINTPTLLYQSTFSKHYIHECLRMYKDMCFCLQEMLKVFNL